MKTPDEWAREFKLPACIGNKKFSAQIKTIQNDAIMASAELVNKEVFPFLRKDILKLAEGLTPK